MLFYCITIQISLIIIEIMPEVRLGPEAQPKDANNRVVLFLLDTKGRKHILMVRRVAEGPNY